ncbi:MAG: lysozyme [Spirillospora sp.]
MNRTVPFALGTIIAGTTLSFVAVASADPTPPPGNPRLVPGQGFPGAGSGLAPQRRPAPRTLAGNQQVLGLDVSNWQGNVDWPGVKAKGGRFAYVKATESINYISPSYAGQYSGSRQAGLIRGAYHFAQPHESTGAAQADYFVDHGGGWTKDGGTLPGALDIEANPYGDINGLNACYDLTQPQAAAWVRDFSDRYRQRTGRAPAIYTTTGWWRDCTGNNAGFGASPLWLARWGSSVGELPAGWATHTIWQYANAGTFPGDQNAFNGDQAALKALADGPATPTDPPGGPKPANLATSAKAMTKIVPGRPAIYSITVANTGSTAFRNVKASGIPYDQQVVTGVKGTGACDYGYFIGACDYSEIGGGDQRTFTVTVKIPLSAKGSVRFLASAYSSVQEQNSDDNHVRLETPVS